MSLTSSAGLEWNHGAAALVATESVGYNGATIVPLLPDDAIDSLRVNWEGDGAVATGIPTLSTIGRCASIGVCWRCGKGDMTEDDGEVGTLEPPWSF